MHIRTRGELVKEKTEIQNVTRIAKMAHNNQLTQVKKPEEGNCAVAQ